MFITRSLFTNDQPMGGKKLFYTKILLAKSSVSKDSPYQATPLWRRCRCQRRTQASSLQASRQESGHLCQSFRSRWKIFWLRYVEHLDTVSLWPPFRSPCQRSPGNSDGFNIVKIAIRQNMPLKRNQNEIHSRRVVMRAILTEDDEDEQHLDKTSRLNGHHSKSFVEKGTICCSTGG